MKTRYNITVYGREASFERMRFAEEVSEVSRRDNGLVPVCYADLLNRIMIVAQVKGVPGLIGHVSLKPAEIDASDERWRQVSTHYVAPEHRGKGVGGLLLGTAAGIARLQDEHLYAYAMGDNPEGLHYFERFGYKQEEIFGRVGMVQRCAAAMLAEEFVA